MSAAGGPGAVAERPVPAPTAQPRRKRRVPRVFRSLLCLIQALEGRIVDVELRSDITITGMLEGVDDRMNLIMVDARTETPQGMRQELPFIFVRGPQIRYVHIPADVNPVVAIDAHRVRLDAAALAYSRGAVGRGRPEAAGGGIHPSDLPAARRHLTGGSLAEAWWGAADDSAADAVDLSTEQWDDG